MSQLCPGPSIESAGGKMIGRSGNEGAPTLREQPPVWSLDEALGQLEVPAVHVLQTVLEHRSVNLAQHVRTHLDDVGAEFLSYLTGRLAPTSGATAADQLLSSAVRPSRQLLALAAEEVQRREMFLLQDQQQTAYRLVLRALEVLVAASRSRRSS